MTAEFTGCQQVSENFSLPAVQKMFSNLQKVTDNTEHAVGSNDWESSAVPVSIFLLLASFAFFECLRDDQYSLPLANFSSGCVIIVSLLHKCLARGTVNKVTLCLNASNT